MTHGRLRLPHPLHTHKHTHCPHTRPPGENLTGETLQGMELVMTEAAATPLKPAGPSVAMVKFKLPFASSCGKRVWPCGRDVSVSLASGWGQSLSI